MTPGNLLIRRGDIFWVLLSGTQGSEQAGRRPVLILQNDTGNELAPTTIIAPLTTRHFEKEYPTNVFVPKGTSGLSSNSVILLSQIRTIDKSRLERRIGSLPFEFMEKVARAVQISLGLR